MRTNATSNSSLLLAMLTSAVLLAACDRGADQRTAGQKLDGAVAATERQADKIAAEARAAGSEARQAVGNATDTVTSKSRDLAITAAVNARLAGDARLSALAINVDTVDGRVVLRGSAPDSASRTRATELARTVDGVTQVTNDLSVKPS